MILFCYNFAITQSNIIDIYIMTGEEVADTIKVDIMSQVKPAHHHGNVLSSQCKTDSLIINIIDALNCTRIKQFLSTEVSYMGVYSKTRNPSLF